MLVAFAYNCFLIFLAIITGIGTLAMRRRFGLLSERLWKKFPSIERNGEPFIWIHAISVGEAMAVAPLVRIIQKEIPNCKILLSSITETGHQTAISAIPTADYHVYLPFDLWFKVNPIIRKVKPDLVILCETDFWYNFLNTAKKEGAQIFLVNGRISETSAKRYKAFYPFSRKLFSLIDYYFVQNADYQTRFQSLGVPSNRIEVMKNLKLDSSFEYLTEEAIKVWKTKLGIDKEDKVIILGSSHYPEEQSIAKVYKELSARIENLRLVIVPRHPDRCPAIVEELSALQLPSQQFSRMEGREAKSIILVDIIGKLKELYQIADAAIVGGSFFPGEGGHNLLEPACFGIPFAFGPFMDSQAAILEIIRQHGVGHQVSLEGLPEVLKKLLDPSEEELARKAGLNLGEFLREKGVSRQTWNAISIALENKKGFLKARD